MPNDTGAAGDTPPASATPAAGSVNANDEQVATDWFDRQMQSFMEALKSMADMQRAHMEDQHSHGAEAAESSGAPSAGTSETRAPAENAPGGQPAAAAPRPERAPRPGHRWFRRLGG